MKYLFLAILCSCTYSISVNHTEGQADDIGDSSPTATATVTPNTNVDLSKK